MSTVATEDDEVLLQPRAPASGHKRRSDLSTARLLQAAARLIAEKGYGRTSLIEIAAESGFSHGLVTLRFGSKEGLLRALFDRMTADWTVREIHPAIAGRVGLDGIRALLDVTRIAVRRNPTNVRALYALMFEAVLGVDVLEERVRAFHESQRVMYHELLVKGIEAGTVRADTNLEETASLIISLLRGAGYQWLLESDYDLDHGLGVIADTLDRLLAA
jgi:AcrR family transcriptional regulator